jgi:hypothetical protein
MGDWRIDNAKHTKGATLIFKRYNSPSQQWDHDHCEGCWAKLMESGSKDTLVEGYVTEDNSRWICPDCFRELKDVMGWKLATIGL